MCKCPKAKRAKHAQAKEKHAVLSKRKISRLKSRPKVVVVYGRRSVHPKKDGQKI
jgi:hypothetical protein